MNNYNRRHLSIARNELWYRSESHTGEEDIWCNIEGTPWRKVWKPRFQGVTATDCEVRGIPWSVLIFLRFRSCFSSGTWSTSFIRKWKNFRDTSFTEFTMAVTQSFFFFSFFFELLFMQGISRKADVTLCNECIFLRGSWKRRRRYGEINAKCQRWPTSASSRTSNGFVTGNLCGRYAIAQSIQTRESHQYTRHTVLYWLFIDHKISKSFEVTYCGGDSSVTMLIYNDFTIAIFFSFRFYSTIVIRCIVRWFPRLIKKFCGNHLGFQRKEYLIKFVYRIYMK